MKGLTATYKFNGLNGDKIINSLKRRDITLYDVKKPDSKTLYITVKSFDSKKVFAISQELCYNIVKVESGGYFYPFYYLVKNIGLIVGIVLFITLSILANDLIFDISYVGSGKIYQKEISLYLKNKGIDKYSKFSSTDLKELSSEILISNSHLSFVSCAKKGNTLEVNLAIANDNKDKLFGNVESLVSDTDGVVESIKVYRGTAVVKVGDAVRNGDTVVQGIATVKEQTVKINVLAVVTIRAEFEYTYTSNNDGEDDIAIMLATSSLEQDVVDERLEKTFINGKYIYKVNLSYRRVIYAG